MDKRVEERRFGINQKIMLAATLVIVVVASSMLILMVNLMKSLSEHIIVDTLQSMTKTASQAVEAVFVYYYIYIIETIFD